MENNLSTDSFFKDKYKLYVVVFSVVMAFASIYFFKPTLDGGDTVTYIQSMNVISTGEIGQDFVPNRFTSTYIGLRTILFVANITGHLWFSWLLVNSILYILLSVVFYSLSRSIFEDCKTAFITTVLFVGNYAAINFGPATLMDIGGWFFYTISVYYSYKFFHTKNINYFWMSALLIAIGSVWKEYSFLAFVVLALSYLFINYRKPLDFILKILLAGVISFLPFIFINIWVYLSFHYSYADWFKYQEVYVYSSRIIEYIKAFGSLYNLGWFVFMAGSYLYIKDALVMYKEKVLSKKTLDYMFILFILVSALPVLAWPAITQRVLFIIMPGVTLVSGIFFKKIQKYNVQVGAFLILYVLASFFMNSYILVHINL